MILGKQFKLNPLICSYGWSDGGIGYSGSDPTSGVGGGTGAGSAGTGTPESSANAWGGGGGSDAGGVLSDYREALGKIQAQEALNKPVSELDTRSFSDKFKAFDPRGQKGMLDYMFDGHKLPNKFVEGIKKVAQIAIPGLGAVNLLSKAFNGEYEKQVSAVQEGLVNAGMSSAEAATMARQKVDTARADMVSEVNTMMEGTEASGTGSTHRSSGSIDPTSELPDEWTQIFKGVNISDNPEDNSIYTSDDASNDVSNMSWEDKLQAYDMTSINSAMDAIKNIDTDISYQHTLADLSGIGMDANEKALLDSQKGIAIDRAITEIEDTFAPEGESIIAQQIHNLGTNALGGTVGQGFVKRWQDREASAKTNALQDIESTYLAAERQGIDTAKQRQMDIWGKEYESDVKSAELGLDKTKAGAGLQYEWDRSYLDRLAQMRGQDITAEQQNLDRLLKERMGNQEYEAWEDSNMWTGIGGVVGSVAGSDWFGDVASSWFS